MEVTSIKPTSSRDLYGKMKCEHCQTEVDLRGGYDDGHWWNKVLPAYHCKACGKNRAGELTSPEVVAKNQENGVNGI